MCLQVAPGLEWPLLERGAEALRVFSSRPPPAPLLPGPSDTPEAALYPGEAGTCCAGRALAWELEGLGAGLGSATGRPCDARYITLCLRRARRPKPVRQHGGVLSQGWRASISGGTPQPQAPQKAPGGTLISGASPHHASVSTRKTLMCVNSFLADLSTSAVRGASP